MNAGVYRAATAMLAELVRQDVHAHNLANADTTGFQRVLAQVVTAPGGDGWVSVVSSTDPSPGPVESTGSPLDVAIRGPGFFVLQSGTGHLYTRNGRFLLDSEGYLVDAQGRRVMGTDGPLRAAGSRVEIAADGTVTADGRRVGRLLVVGAASFGQLRRRPGGASGVPLAPLPRVTLQPGALEGSNVSVVEEIVQMQNGLRVYEANSRVISSVDRSLSRLIETATG